VQVFGTEGPSIDDLVAVSVDDLYRLILVDPAGAPLARRHCH
jgi:hypothetical protein